VSNPYGNDPYGQPNPYGGAGGAGGAYPPPPGGGGFEQPKTDGVSIAALITGILCCGIIPLILGFIGLGRTKGGQRKGRGMAITGIVLGFLGLFSWVGIGILAAAGWDFLDDVRAIDDLEKGQCINGSGLKATDDDHSVGIITEVDCSDAHDAEVVATSTLSAEEADAYGSEGDQGPCDSMLDAALLDKVNNENYFLLALTQSKDPDEGDHLVCVISLANGDDLTEDLF